MTNMNIYRVYVEKKEGFRHEPASLLAELREFLGVRGLTGLRILRRYDVRGLDPELWEKAGVVVFSEPPVDDIFADLPEYGRAGRFGAEFLPGQFDQRADSCAECLQVLGRGGRPEVRCANVYLLEGALAQDELERVKRHLINPVEAREADIEAPPDFGEEAGEPGDTEILTGFGALDAAGLSRFIGGYGLAMSARDAAFCQAYFKAEGRDPTLAEIRVIDTYWSDHCRHTTFLTHLDSIELDDPRVGAAYRRYLALRDELKLCGGPVTLMDIATIGAKYLKKTGALACLDESGEINACSVRIDAEVGGKAEPWLIMFKNETHNHPTEIEPFGGAATCIGGAIRDPLSGRSYVYQAMRVTGAGDPRAAMADTLPGKLPQRKIVIDAARGYSSYGNQVGIATGFVDEVYHPGYIAKRMEIGAVIGAAPAGNVRRAGLTPGDVIVLLGGRTGRDGIGGATGSSKSHGGSSLAACGAEVQKGNAPVERKLQRLFRNPDAARLIKRCNDFGAGGVCVAIGELADGITVNLDAVPRKYEGLSGTELAISESQERMAVALDPGDLDAFMEMARAENLEASAVARVTEEPRFAMTWRDKVIADFARDFLNSNGAPRSAAVFVGRAGGAPPAPEISSGLQSELETRLSDLNACSRRGLIERFDSTIGAGTLFMPFGGRYGASPMQIMAAKLPADGETDNCTGMAYGFDPYLAERDPFEGARRAVYDSVIKLVAAGFPRGRMWLSFQEYFERLRDEPARWGRPFAALLGALSAQLELGVAAIGGKDSMSGSFELPDRQLDVPPSLVSFAVSAGRVGGLISPEFKNPGSRVAFFPVGGAADLDKLEELICRRGIISAWTVCADGVAGGLCKMSFGNRLGVRLDGDFPQSGLFSAGPGVIAEMSESAAGGVTLGFTIPEFVIAHAGEAADLAAVQRAWEGALEPVFPTRTADKGPAPELRFVPKGGPPLPRRAPSAGFAAPRALIPVFPGTNCETDTSRALKRAGAAPEELVIRNLSAADIVDSVERVSKRLAQCQMLVLPGGFSGGDEPDGSAKLIAAFFRSPRVSEAVSALLRRGGLILGICNGFQALIKLGLLPFGEIRELDASCPTLTFNAIGRHQSLLARTRVASTLSPWFSLYEPGELQTVAMSHGEGRFVAADHMLKNLAENGQIAAQYADGGGAPAMGAPYNPNGSAWAVEALSSADGRILGRMGHSERMSDDLYKNIPGDKSQRLFLGGVNHFK